MKSNTFFFLPQASCFICYSSIVLKYFMDRSFNILSLFIVHYHSLVFLSWNSQKHSFKRICFPKTSEKQYIRHCMPLLIARHSEEQHRYTEQFFGETMHGALSGTSIAVLIKATYSLLHIFNNAHFSNFGPVPDVCMYVCMYVCVCCIHTHTHTHTIKRVCVSVYKFRYTSVLCICVCMYI